jgi:hypothetical protein
MHAFAVAFVNGRGKLGHDVLGSEPVSFYRHSPRPNEIGRKLASASFGSAGPT